MVQNSRLIVGIGNNAKLQYWIKTHLFQFSSLKTFIESTYCGDTKPNYTLVSRNASTYSIICNINYIQHQCDLNTLILNTFLCDGICDCFDKSDENNCTVPFTSYTSVWADKKRVV